MTSPPFHPVTPADFKERGDTFCSVCEAEWWAKEAGEPCPCCGAKAIPLVDFGEDSPPSAGNH